jgi:hypothetical protein
MRSPSRSQIVFTNEVDTTLGLSSLAGLRKVHEFQGLKQPAKILISILSAIPPKQPPVRYLVWRKRIVLVWSGSAPNAMRSLRHSVDSSLLGILWRVQCFAVVWVLVGGNNVLCMLAKDLDTITTSHAYHVVPIRARDR